MTKSSMNLPFLLVVVLCSFVPCVQAASSSAFTDTTDFVSSGTGSSTSEQLFTAVYSVIQEGNRRNMSPSTQVPQSTIIPADCMLDDRLLDDHHPDDPPEGDVNFHDYLRSFSNSPAPLENSTPNGMQGRDDTPNAMSDTTEIPDMYPISSANAIALTHAAFHRTPSPDIAEQDAIVNIDPRLIGSPASSISNPEEASHVPATSNASASSQAIVTVPLVEDLQTFSMIKDSPVSSSHESCVMRLMHKSEKVAVRGTLDVDEQDSLSSESSDPLLSTADTSFDDPFDKHSTGNQGRLPGQQQVVNAWLQDPYHTGDRYARSDTIPVVERSVGRRKRRNREVNGFPCEHHGCNMKKSTQRDLNLHKRVHIPQSERANACTYDDCSQAFNSPAELKRHVSDRHTGDHKLSCLYCDQGCRYRGRKDNLTRHISRVHARSVLIHHS